MTASDLQRWSRDVAEDPGSPSFVPLARAYRRQGRRDAAMAVVLRGLERNPEHLEAHALLALLHVDAGDRLRAGDEWEMILRFDPTNFDARRGLGFLALEGGELEKARTHLDAAAAARPGDPTVAQAREVLARREARGTAVSGTSPAAPPEGPPASRPRDPGRVFSELEGDAPFQGALLVDGSGLILAGGLRSSAGDGEALGALLTPAVEEAARAVALLGIGDWEGMLMESEAATLHIAPIAGAVLVLVASTGAPPGWVVRAAARARELARSFLGGPS